ncbi:hypothetical protein SEA_COMRADE_243 [Streptomyces phage Comrade]|uniref:Uncharacterized protein n=1 Tax=Streptomyces phage Comrade TaxID=2301714 RepID=A0A385DVQ3_9CAUD|nr:hypothetical protein HWB84_gp035 [Streptomyces phage Comrade]AXQ63474.1 hypothetical protein SEA_COMRADE_243 [Streptomyces phage Comrade]
MIFTVTELLPKKYMEDSQDLEFVAEIKGFDAPRKDDKLVIRGQAFRAAEVERNYDNDTMVVYVTRIVKDDDEF